MEPMTLIVIVLLILFYFLPVIIADKRGHPNWTTIGALNLLAGWTILGWIAALIWACAGNTEGRPTPKTHVKCPDCAELVRKEAKKCKHCGCALKPQP